LTIPNELVYNNDRGKQKGEDPQAWRLNPLLDPFFTTNEFGGR